MLSGPTIEQYRNRQGDEEQHSKKNQHQVQIEGRIDLRDVWEEQRTSQKEKCLLDQPLAEHQFRGRRGEATKGTLIRGTGRTTVKTAGHAGEYTVRFRVAYARG